MKVSGAQCNVGNFQPFLHAILYPSCCHSDFTWNQIVVNSIGQKKSFLANLEVLNFVFWSVWAIFQVPNLPKDLFYVKLKNSVIWQCGNLMILHSLLIFYGKLKNQVKSQCGNLMISHSISQISCEITFMQMQNLCFWQIRRFWIGIFSHFLHFLEGWIVQNWNGIQCTLFFCTFWTDFTTVWWYLKDLPQWLHLNWLICCHI